MTWKRRRGKKKKTHIVNDLVEKLHRVAAKHDGDDAPVDAAAQLLEVDGVYAGHVAVLVEKDPGGVDVGAARRGVVVVVLSSMVTGRGRRAGQALIDLEALFILFRGGHFGVVCVCVSRCALHREDAKTTTKKMCR